MESFFYKDFSPWFIPIILWTLFWKGYALWTAVKNNHKKWFVALVILNTLGILEIIYVFYVAKKKWIDIKHSLNKAIK
jgi:hypothetical protein